MLIQTKIYFPHIFLFTSLSMYHFQKVPSEIKSQKVYKIRAEYKCRPNTIVIVNAVIQFCKAVFFGSNYRDPEAGGSGGGSRGRRNVPNLSERGKPPSRKPGIGQEKLAAGESGAALCSWRMEAAVVEEIHEPAR
jgi:hypothetical protein